MLFVVLFPLATSVSWNCCNFTVNLDNVSEQKLSTSSDPLPSSYRPQRTVGISRMVEVGVTNSSGVVGTVNHVSHPAETKL